MIDSYVNSGESRHTALFRFMTQVACRAERRGFDITPDQIAELARDVDRMSSRQTNPNRWDRIHYEAERALSFARTCASTGRTDSI
jgi:hypothetical protein